MNALPPAAPLRLFAPAIAFVDLETTGLGPATDAITEIAIIRVAASPEGNAPPTVDEWSTLVKPGRPIPAAIQRLTGITDAMVRDAPSFAAVAGEVRRRTAGAVFVAHNAQFDYGFLKHACARIGVSFNARVLCTVKLSRRLFPDAAQHGLDAVIARHALPAVGRHRALGDARALWSFVQALYRDLPVATIDAAVSRVLRVPSLPPQLPADALDALPETPGVYRFYGLDTRPLFIGNSRNLRRRVAAHFSSDCRSATDRRLSADVRRIEYEETAGEVGARLRASVLIKALLPAPSHARCRRHAAALSVPQIPAWPYAGAIALREHDALTGRTDLHVIRDWCWLGTATDESELESLIDAPPRPEFDPGVMRLLLRTLAHGRHEVIALPRREA